MSPKELLLLKGVDRTLFQTVDNIKAYQGYLESKAKELDAAESERDDLLLEEEDPVADATKLVESHWVFVDFLRSTLQKGRDDSHAFRVEDWQNANFSQNPPPGMPMADRADADLAQKSVAWFLKNTALPTKLANSAVEIRVRYECLLRDVCGNCLKFAPLRSHTEVLASVGHCRTRFGCCERCFRELA